jgi:hypothetical protein
MAALVISIDVLISLLCWILVWQLIRLQPQIVALVEILDSATMSVERLGLVPEFMNERQQSIQRLHQFYQQPILVIDRLGQLLRLLLWVRTRR